MFAFLWYMSTGVYMMCMFLRVHKWRYVHTIAYIMQWHACGTQRTSLGVRTPLLPCFETVSCFVVHWLLHHPHLLPVSFWGFFYLCLPSQCSRTGLQMWIANSDFTWILETQIQILVATKDSIHICQSFTYALTQSLSNVYFISIESWKRTWTLCIF